MAGKKSTSTALTERQRTILGMIRSSVESRGYPPSIREIGEAVGLTSPSSVAYQLRTMERKGYIRRDPHRPRAMEVVSSAKAAAKRASAERDSALAAATTKANEYLGLLNRTDFFDCCSARRVWQIDHGQGSRHVQLNFRMARGKTRQMPNQPARQESRC